MRATIQSVLLAIFLILAPKQSFAGWLKDRVNDVKKIVKVIPQVPNPLQVQIDIVRGKDKPDKAIKQFVEDQGATLATISNSTRSFHNSIDHKFNEVAASLGGDFGRVVYEIGTGSQRLQNEFVFTATNASAALLQGQDPLLSLAMPLAAAIRDARNKHIASARAIPGDLIELFQPVIPKNVLQRARYAIGELKISLPTIISETNRMFGGDFAVTVDDVIVFPRELDLDNPDDIKWLAHELHHVFQYMEWDVDLFAYRYLKHSSRVEAEAEHSASYVMSYISQLGVANIQPNISMGRMLLANPTKVNTPLGQTTIFIKSNSTNYDKSVDSMNFTDRCFVNGDQVAITSGNKVISMLQGGIQVGFRVPPADTLNCVFDLISNRSGQRYCVHRPSGPIYPGTPFHVGQCQPCVGQSCIL